MKIIKDSICCKKKEIEKQTGGNGDVILTEVQNNKTKAFVSKDAMKIICNLNKFNLGDDIYITGDAKIHGMVIDGGEKYLKLEYPILYLKYKNKINNLYLNYEDTQVGIFKVWLNNNGYIFSISNLNTEFLEKCELLLTNKDIKNCSYIDVEEKIFNNGAYYYIKNKSYSISKLCVKLKLFYKNIQDKNKKENAYWDDSTKSCREFKEMVDFSKDDKITNAGFYKKILTDKNIKSPHGFLVHLDDVNQKCLIGNNLGAAMGSFFKVENNESGKLPRYVITYEQGQQYHKIIFKSFGDNLNFKKT